jgi:hypothetical protein
MLDDMVEYGGIVDENWESREAVLNVLEVKLRGSITDICRSNSVYTRDWLGVEIPASLGQHWLHLSAHSPLR